MLIVINKNELEDFARRELISEELIGFLVFAAHLCSCGRLTRGRTRETIRCDNLRC